MKHVACELSIEIPVCEAAHSRLEARSNYAFKPTAEGVFRSNLPLPCGGGLTRR